jgi:hypothetical protein
MRAKIILPVLILGCAIIAVLKWQYLLNSENPATLPPVTTTISKSDPPANYPGGTVENPPTPLPAPAVAAPATNQSPAVAAQIIEKLQSIAMNNDAESLQAILSELNNIDPEIRAAAREAAVQFGDRSAAAPLRAAAAQAVNLEEKTALLAAADYLELPSLEVRPVATPRKFSQPVTNVTPP